MTTYHVRGDVYRIFLCFVRRSANQANKALATRIESIELAKVPQTIDGSERTFWHAFKGA